MAETLKEKKSPLRIVGIVMLVNYLGPLLIWVITGGSVSAVFFALSITNALLGLAFLCLCLPLGHHMDLFQRTTFPLAIFGKVMDVVVRHSFLLFGWPQSRVGWSLTFVALAAIFLVVALSAFFCAIGDMQSDKALTEWVEHTFKALFRH
jgi:hypothetical protein